MQRIDSNARIIIFDGICHVCSGGVKFLVRHRIEPLFGLIPMQSAEGGALLERFGIDAEDPTTFGGLWRLAVVVRVIPLSFRDWLYRLLARARAN
jgi:predicted DCC family thiol-disulfide oxidoreductase YuxK